VKTEDIIIITLDGKVNEIIIAECSYCAEKVKPSVMDIRDAIVCSKCWNEQMRENWWTDILIVL
jgi:formylmethanofuran dehydrogenase subunit E